jgi:hypothetical protein
MTQGKRGPKIASAVTLGLMVGGVGSSLVARWIVVRPIFKAAGVVTPALLTPALFSLPLWIFLVMAIVGVWWWLK